MIPESRHWVKVDQEGPKKGTEKYSLRGIAEQPTGCYTGSGEFQLGLVSFGEVEMEKVPRAVGEGSRESAVEPAGGLLTAKEAANYLRISLFTLRKIEQQGMIVPYRTPGGHRRYSIEMLNEYLERSRLAPPVD